MVHMINIDRSINNRHRAYCCINDVLVFALFTIILLVLYYISYQYCIPRLAD